MNLSLNVSQVLTTTELKEATASSNTLSRTEAISEELFGVSGTLSVKLLDALQLPLPHSIETLSFRPEGIFFGVNEEFTLPAGRLNPLEEIGLFIAPAGTLAGLPVFALAERTLHDGLARWVALNNGSSYLLHSSDQLLCLEAGKLSNIQLREQLPNMDLEDLTLYSDGSGLYLHSLGNRLIQPLKSDFTIAGKSLRVGDIVSFKQTNHGLYCLDSSAIETRTLRIFRDAKLYKEICFSAPVVPEFLERLLNAEEVLIDHDNTLYFIDHFGVSHRLELDGSLELAVTQSEYTKNDSENEERQLNWIQDGLLYHVRGSEIHIWDGPRHEGIITFNTQIDEIMVSNANVYVLLEDSRLLLLHCESNSGAVIEVY